jgi:hypothetical protein
MVVEGAIGRFARWGLTHGPVWGTVSAVIAGIPLARMLDVPLTYAELIVLGAVAGLVSGPVLAVLVSVMCLAAERVPRWILDAPDYVAVLTVVGFVAMIAWPTLQLADASIGISVVGIALIAAAPSVDAARTAPKLLHPGPDRPPS